jgi:AcrR family transcriptional regulator
MMTTDHTGPAGRRRILAAAIEVLETEGEAALRVVQIAERAEVVPGLINHHFGSRDGLVAEAQRQRFAGASDKDQQKLARLVSGQPTRDEFVAALSALTRDIASRRRAKVRLARTAMVGAAHGRPQLQEQLTEVATEITTGLTHIIQKAQLAGFIRLDLDARAIATFLQAYSFGLVLADLDAERPSAAEVEQTISVAVEGFFTAP